MKRRGILGGTFDPIHYGHLLLAEGAREHCSLDHILFVPAGTPPHKRHRPRTDGQQRSQMIALAVAPWPEYELEPFEIETPGVSYTIRTIEYLEKKYPGDELFLIIGSETLADLPNWYCPERLCSKVTLAVAHRCGFPEPDFSPLASFVPNETLCRWRQGVIPMPQIEISSTKIRERVVSGKSVRFLLPPSVENYLLEKEIYS